MKHEAKVLLTNSLDEFKSVNEARKVKLIKFVEQRVEQHNNGLNTIGFGYADHFVEAGKVFLRIVKSNR
jgi:hypothetical protein